jgi:hypothetical protein
LKASSQGLIYGSAGLSPNETADAVAAASFDKCGDLWDLAHQRYLDRGQESVSFTPAQINANLYLLSDGRARLLPSMSKTPSRLGSAQK